MVGGLLESLSRCQLGVRHSPRVTVVVQTVGLADWVGLPNPHSCRYCGTNRGANPSSCRYRGVNPADKIPYRGVNPAHKIPHRVVIVVPIPPRVVIVVPTPPRVAIVVSIQRIRSLIVRGATKLLSLLWYKPGVRLPPRVANMVQTPGETLAGKPVDVSVSIR